MMTCSLVARAVVLVAALLNMSEDQDDDTGEVDPNALSMISKGCLFRKVYETLHSSIMATA